MYFNVTGYPNLLTYITAKDIRIVNVTKNNAKDTVIIRDLEGVAVDFCYERGLICWTDHVLEVIQCANYNGTHASNRVSNSIFIGCILFFITNIMKV